MNLHGFFNESVSFFGLGHFVRRCCALLPYEFHLSLQGFLRPELFFQREFLFFWSEAFCKTVLCVFSYVFTQFLRPGFFFQRECLFFFQSVARCFWRLFFSIEILI